MLKLSDQEKQEIIRFLEADKDLPEKYRFLLGLTSAARECPPGRRKIAVKVVDIFGNDTMAIVEVRV